jgi:hypothetical protein
LTGQRQAADRSGVHPSIWLGFVPWILFAVICRRDTLQAAVVSGLVAALVISAPIATGGLALIASVYGKSKSGRCAAVADGTSLLHHLGRPCG